MRPRRPPTKPPATVRRAATARSPGGQRPNGAAAPPASGKPQPQSGPAGRGKPAQQDSHSGPRSGRDSDAWQTAQRDGNSAASTGSTSRRDVASRALSEITPGVSSATV